MQNKTRGFTLLEMSIVMIIIALIVGGTLVGQSLIRQSQIRSMLGEYDAYLKAIKEFQNKYESLPGDYTGASTGWGVGVSNGDGSGTVGTSNTSGAVTSGNEWFMLWQHLALAGFIQGRFSGTGTGNGAVIGTNVPASKLSGGGWTFFYYLNPDGIDVTTWPDFYGHIMTFGPNNSGTYTSGNIMSPAEMYLMDKKLDDGLPGTGKIRSVRKSSSVYCTVEASQSDSTYNNDNSAYTNSNVCWPFFLTGM